MARRDLPRMGNGSLLSSAARSANPRVCDASISSRGIGGFLFAPIVLVLVTGGISICYFLFTIQASKKERTLMKPQNSATQNASGRNLSSHPPDMPIPDALNLILSVIVFLAAVALIFFASAVHNW